MPAPPRTKREHLRRLVEGKNRWSDRKLNDNERALGFLGWHERGYLPHCDFPNLVQFVTFRLQDSMPAARRDEWEQLLKIKSIRERRTKLEEYLDRGVGNCLLRDPCIGKITEEALLHFHDQWYELLAWCIMPNHVHVLVNVRLTPLWKIIQNWKIRSTREVRRITIVKRLGSDKILKDSRNEPSRCSALQLKWQREYWDTFMRDSEQERKAIRYIENNPVKAKLCRTRADWFFSSARYRDEYRRLTLPPAGKPSESSAPAQKPARQIF